MVSPDDIRAAGQQISIAEQKRRQDNRDNTGRLEFELKKSDCRECGKVNDNADELCQECRAKYESDH